MTLVLSLAERGQAFQVVDRRVSMQLSTGRLVGVHDEYFNKTVILRGVDGLCSCSFAGPAYIGRMPTDQVLAESLFGSALDPQVVQSTMASLPAKSMWELLEAGFERLRVARAAAGSVDTLQVECIGLQEKDRGLIPFSRRYSFFGERLVSETPVPRHAGPNPLHVTVIGSGVDVLPDSELIESLTHAEDSNACLGALISALRRASTKLPSVGPNAVFVQMLPESARRDGGRPDRVISAVGYDAVRRDEKGLLFGPWHLGQGAVHAPSVQKLGEDQRISGLLNARGHTEAGSLLDEAVWLQVAHPRLKPPR